MHEQIAWLNGECNLMEHSERKVVTMRAHLLLQWQLYFPLSVAVVIGF